MGLKLNYLTGQFDIASAAAGVGSGTVTSVDMTVPGFLSVSGNPITTAGTLAVTLNGFTDGSIPFVSGTGTTFSQDNTKLFWDATNKGLKIGGSSIVAAQTSPNVYIASTNSTAANAGFVHENANAGTQGGTYSGRKSRGTLTVPAAVSSGDTLSSFIGFGYGTSAYNSSSDVAIFMVAAENFTNTARGTQFNFQTTNIGSATKRTTMQLTPGGSLAMLDSTGVTQQIRINATGGQTMPSGTSAATSIQALVANQNLGIWTANNGAGNSADLRIETGTATGTRGKIVLNAPILELSNAAHLRSTQTTVPVATVDANAGTGATSTVSNATDVAGIINLTTTAVAPSAGTQTSIAFNKAYAVAPIVNITPRTADAANFSIASGVYVTTTITTMEINFANLDAAGHAYSWFYQVIETQ